MRKYNILLTVLVISLILCSCNVSKHKNDTKYDDMSLSDSRIYFSDTNAMKLFATEYQLKNLLKSEVYLVDDKLNISMYFNEKITKEEVDQSISYLLKFAVIKYTKYVAFPFQTILNQDIKFNFVTLRLFTNNELIVCKEVDIPKMHFDYYENVEPILKAREVEYNFINSYFDILSKNSLVQYRVIKPFKSGIILVKMNSLLPVSNKKVEYIKKQIEEKLIPQLKIENATTLSRSPLYGITLCYNDSKGNISQTTLEMKKNPKWSSENWMNIITN